MLVQQGNTTLTDDEYLAYYAMVKEKSVALSESLEHYEENAARTEARISDIEAQMEALAMYAQPLELGLQDQAHGANYAPMLWQHLRESTAKGQITTNAMKTMMLMMMTAH